MDITAKLPKTKPRTVLLCKRGNMEGVREDLKTFYEEEILPFKDEMSVESTWKIFTEKLQNSFKKYIPTKTISGRWDVPWMTQHMKRKIHQKHRMYNNYQKNK